MSIQLTITANKADGQYQRVSGFATISGSYVSGGDTASILAAIQDAAFQGLSTQIDTTIAPLDFDFWDVGGNIANGVFPVIGSLSGCKVKFTSAFNSELSASSYPASITGSKYCWEAVLAKGI